MPDSVKVERFAKALQNSEFDVVVAASPENTWYLSEAIIDTQRSLLERLALALRDVDERAPFKTSPRRQKDGRTKYRRVRRGRGEVWQCPKHPKECPTAKVVPGDPN